MTKTKSTKRALLTSALALLMCVSMLIGSTFAWFTDSVTSGRNKIVAGNLDVVLEYKTPDSTDWAEVTSDTVLFSENSLWEPGHTEVVALRIKNAGTLALKYDLATTVYEEKAGTNKDGDTFLLSDYLEVGYSAIQQDNEIGDYFMDLILGSREQAAKLAGSGFGESVENPNPVIAPGEAHVCALAVTMPETVGNEANYKTGTEAPFISFGVTLLATQATVESDSFDNQYDKNAEYAVNAGTIDGIANALAMGENIALTDDIDVTAENKLGASYGFLTYNSSIDGGGKTITDDSASRVSAFYAGNIDYIRNLTLKTNSVYGIFASAKDRDMSISNVTIEKSSKGAVLYTEATKNLILDNVVMTGTGTGATASAAHAVVFATGSSSSPSNITINSGTYKATDANGYAVASFYGSVVTINGGTFTGKLTTDGTGKIVIKGGTFNVDPSAYVADGYVATESNGVWIVTK